MTDFKATSVTDDKRLRTERQADGSRVLLRDLNVNILERPYKVPEGFETDYSSIPWYARFIVRWSKVDLAGVVHDRLYIKGTPLTRVEADRVWREVARTGKNRANPLQAWLGWAGLRVGGWVAWRKYRAKD